jgi:protease I
MARIAIIVGEGFEDSEFLVPYDRLKKAGHEVDVMGIEAGAEIKGKRGRSMAHVDIAAHAAYPDHYDALIIPGGFSPDRLRTNSDVVAFVQGFANSGKPLAAICHGPQLLIEAEAVKGKTLTSWPSVKTDLLNAGAMWIDQDVVVDNNLITSRKPADLDAFTAAIEQALEHPPPHRSHVVQAATNTAAPSMPNIKLDEEGFLLNTENWDEGTALWLAQQEGLKELSEEQWQVIFALREHYQQHHSVPDLRHICEAAHQEDVYCLERHFDNDGTKAWRIAGLPNPGEEMKAYL